MEEKQGRGGKRGGGNKEQGLIGHGGRKRGREGKRGGMTNRKWGSEGYLSEPHINSIIYYRLLARNILYLNCMCVYTTLVKNMCTLY